MIRFGLIGTSEISTKMAAALHRCEKATPFAVYSRKKEKGAAFAEACNVPNVVTSLEELAQLSDAIYIASPNSLHCEQTLFFLERGIPVLCEKPLASNLSEVRRMVECACRNDVYFAEAYKSMLMPAFRTVQELLPSVGQIRNVCLEFSKYSTRYDAHKRGEDVNTFRAEFSNGALLDLGVYCLYPVLALFGEPRSVCSSGILVPGGVDGVGSAILTYPDFLVTLNYSKISGGFRPSAIQGEKGTILMDAVSSPRTVELRLNNGEIRQYSPETEPADMVYECDAFVAALERGDKVDPSFFYSAFRILDAIRANVGIHYPADE